MCEAWTSQYLIWCQEKRAADLQKYQGILEDQFQLAWKKLAETISPAIDMEGWKNFNYPDSAPTFRWRDDQSRWCMYHGDLTMPEPIIKGLILGCQIITEAYIICALEEAITGASCGFSGKKAYRSAGLSQFRLKNLAKVIHS